MGKLSEIHSTIRRLSKLAIHYAPDFVPPEHFALKMHGYSEATISLAVCKKIQPPEFALDQAKFMIYLGDQVCPKVLAIDLDCYCMEYLYPAELRADSLRVQERILQEHVWWRPANWIDIEEFVWRGSMQNNIHVRVPAWAMEPISVIHGDPTLDNVLTTEQGFIRITDPIPPRWLNKPSIRAVDYGKMLQSALGWELVLRGQPYIEFEWPEFMLDFTTARRAVFWAMVALKRIVYRDIFDSATQWGTRVSNELEELCKSLS